MQIWGNYPIYLPLRGELPRQKFFGTYFNIYATDEKSNNQI